MASTSRWGGTVATKQYQCEQKVYTNQGGLLPGFRTAQASSHLLEGRTWAWAGGSPAAHTPRSSSLPSSPRGLAGGFGDEGGWAERPALMTGADVLPALPLARAGVSNSARVERAGQAQFIIEQRPLLQMHSSKVSSSSPVFRRPAHCPTACLCLLPCRRAAGSAGCGLPPGSGCWRRTGQDLPACAAAAATCLAPTLHWLPGSKQALRRQPAGRSQQSRCQPAWTATARPQETTGRSAAARGCPAAGRHHLWRPPLERLL